MSTNNALSLLKNMGFRYSAFRIWYEFKRRSGLQKISYPTSFTNKQPVSLYRWRIETQPFFFTSRSDISQFKLDNSQKQQLENSVNLILKGNIQFFNGEYINLGKDYDWITNPKNNFKFDKSVHWTKINDFVSEQGDIKYVWEKSRFCYLYAIIRYDFHFGKDHSEFIYNEILSWINHNPINCGPNYKCSQEISLRILNWIFALYFYKYSQHLDESTFQLILNSIYWQIKHVEKNINFSRFTVRNNHAITESLCLYTAGLLFPWFPEAKRWEKSGKKYLEEEGCYQMYEDGSYLQHSMNYHRIVIQLYAWALYLARINNDSFSSTLHDRLDKSIIFLYQHQDEQTGFLPHYGPNDGAIFFQLNSCNYRDFRPQLNSLYFALQKNQLYNNGPWSEDIYWFNSKEFFKNHSLTVQKKLRQESSSFKEGGYYILRGHNRFCFIRCAGYKHRPYQNDNLHCDIWHNGENLLRDSGTYLYNADANILLRFEGTAAHNTIKLDGLEQMKRGHRFTWFNWPNVKNAQLSMTDEYIEFTGTIQAYSYISPSIQLKRHIKQFKNKITWEIQDWVYNWNGEKMQLWNVGPNFFKMGFNIYCVDEKGKPIELEKQKGYYAETYGLQHPSTCIVFKTAANYFHSTIYKEE